MSTEPAEPVESAEPARPLPQALTVMTRNVYIGGQTLPILLAENQAAFLAAVLRFQKELGNNDPQGRHGAIAREIAAARPDLVGVQELTSLGMIRPDGKEVAIDNKDLLTNGLAAARSDQRFLAEDGGVEARLPMPGGGAVTLRARTAVFARAGLEVTKTTASPYDALTTFGEHLEGGPLKSLSGWVRSEIDLGGIPVSIVVTHLEAWDEQVRQAQARELIDLLADVTGPVVVMGDLNSTPDGERAGAFRLLTEEAGFTDAWAVTNPDDAGPTCARSENLRAPTLELVDRLDHVLVRGGVSALEAHRTGYRSDERTPRGLWPSDHAGVVARLSVSPH